MLAYVFWHRPAEGVSRDAYEDRLRSFHATLEVPSAAFRLDALPWRPEAGGYEDWYLVEDWAALGALNEAAIAAARRDEHDAAARLSGEGWAGVWKLVRGGPPEPPASVTWADAPSDDAPAVWQRQMTLGPAPEFCLTGGPGLRARVA